MKENLQQIISQNIFSEADRYLALFINRLNGQDDFFLSLTVAVLSNFLSKGNVCLELPFLANKNLSEILGEPEDLKYDFYFPPLEKMFDDFRESKLVFIPEEQGDDSQVRPLVLTLEGKFYFYRYWYYEQQLAKNFMARLFLNKEIVLNPCLEKKINQILPEGKEENFQRLAVMKALAHQVCLITGGPGTGKTFTASIILDFLIEQAKLEGKDLKIALVAPTGKAAIRLQQAIQKNRDYEIEAFTIHRLIGYTEDSGRPRYNSDNPLPYDALLVDEASMIDLSLMLKLVEAIPLKTRLILLGDKDQLASVEAGFVFGDLVQVLAKSENCLVELTKNYRFQNAAGLHKFSLLLKEGEWEKIDLFLDQKNLGVKFIPQSSLNNFFEDLGDIILEGCQAYQFFEEKESLHEILSKFIILSPVKKGPGGVREINKRVRSLFNKGDFGEEENFYFPGCPLIINQNDYNYGLFNGDLGIVAGQKELIFFWPLAEQKVSSLDISKLPVHDLAYAITVHKSQGSEFDQVLLILPDQPSPLLTRELLYTAVTRAKKEIIIWGKKEILKFMVNNRLKRSSGLKEAFVKNS